jgi:hypothetical protein
MKRRVLMLLALAALAMPATAHAGATKISKNHCEVSGGGEIVEIPEFPGERIDRRLLSDIEYLRKRFKIYIADGYSTDKSHQINGEHPLGLALDILPDESIGGSWRLIGKLARWAEPRQNGPRVPFRWVGYWGDKHHGPRDHLHLSWNHSPTKPKHVARSVSTIRCPGS